MWCKPNETETAKLTKQLALELKNRGLSKLPEGASREELIRQAIAEVAELGDKCKLAVEILSSTEILEANKIVAKETKSLAIATSLMALFTLGLLADAAIKNWREFQNEKHDQVLQQREAQLAKTESDLHLKRQSITDRENKVKTREQNVANREAALKPMPKKK